MLLRRAIHPDSHGGDRIRRREERTELSMKDAHRLNRWLDLLTALLRHRFPVTFEQLIEEVPAYAAEQKDESRRRTFERDKDELRKFGVPIVTKEAPDGGPQGYLLRKPDFYLPYLTLRSPRLPRGCASLATRCWPSTWTRRYASSPATSRWTQRAERDFSLDTVIKDGEAFQAATPGILRLRYSPRIARWIAEREGKTLAEDGSLTRDHPLADRDWAVRHVLQYGADVTVLEPAEVREAVRHRLEAMAAG
jgi:predicted DNA-binding transcriptional regulator YafY